MAHIRWFARDKKETQRLSLAWPGRACGGDRRCTLAMLSAAAFTRILAAISHLSALSERSRGCSGRLSCRPFHRRCIDMYCCFLTPRRLWHSCFKVTGKFVCLFSVTLLKIRFDLFFSFCFSEPNCRVLVPLYDVITVCFRSFQKVLFCTSNRTIGFNLIERVWQIVLSREIIDEAHQQVQPLR